MKRRIFSGMLLLTAVSLLLTAAVLFWVFSREVSDAVTDGLRSRAEAFSAHASDAAVAALSGTDSADMRVTVVAPDGTVVFDNLRPAHELPSHADRPEIQDALLFGRGQSRRFSDALDEETVYYAVRLTDGFVLRVAKTRSSIIGMLTDSLPLVFFLVLALGLLGYLLAVRLTRRIVAPINRVNLDENPAAPYEELSPFVRTIAAQRGRIEQQLADLERRSATIRVIMDNMNEGIVLVDKRGTVLAANRSILRTFGAGGPAEGKHILELHRAVSFSERVHAALDGSPGEMTLELGGGVYRAYFSPVEGSGAIVLLLEITERAMAEQMRREFSANVSHELKTPLTSILGNAELLCEGMVSEGDKPVFYQKIQDEARRLIALIEDIILISRLDEGGGETVFEPVDLTAAAGEAIEALAGTAARLGVTVSLAGGPVSVPAGRSMMVELFFNLIDNAIAYNKPGGTVRVTVARTDGVITCTVADSGVGIPREAQGRVFERFYRVDASRSRKTGGTGLGLAIVRHIVLLHGGKIELQSTPGRGTTITVTFPGA